MPKEEGITLSVDMFSKVQRGTISWVMISAMQKIDSIILQLYGTNLDLRSYAVPQRFCSGPNKNLFGNVCVCVCVCVCTCVGVRVYVPLLFVIK